MLTWQCSLVGFPCRMLLIRCLLIVDFMQWKGHQIARWEKHQILDHICKIAGMMQLGMLQWSNGWRNIPYDRNLSLNEHLYKIDNFLKQKSKVCPCFCSLNETHTSLKCLLFVSHFFDSLQGGHLPKLDTKSCSLPFFSHFIWHSIRPMRLLNGHLELVPAVLQSFSLTLYKTEIPLNRKASVGPCRSSVVFLNSL